MADKLVKKEQEAIVKHEAAYFEDAFASEADLLVMPVARVMQPTSQMLQDPDYDFRQGDIVNTLLAEKLPEKFVPITWHQSNIFFLPKNEIEKKQVIKDFKLPADFDEMFVCRSQDGVNVTTSRIGKTTCQGCPYNKFGWDGNPDTPPICTNSLNFLALFEGQDAPVVIQFANTSRSEGKRLYSLIKYSGSSAKPWERQYSLTSRRQQNKDNETWFVLKVKPAGRPDEAFLAQANSLARDFSGVAFTVADDFEQTEMSFDEGEAY